MYGKQVQSDHSYFRKQRMRAITVKSVSAAILLGRHCAKAPAFRVEAVLDFYLGSAIWEELLLFFFIFGQV
jgi:hypothetical protein